MNSLKLAIEEAIGVCIGVERNLGVSVTQLGIHVMNTLIFGMGQVRWPIGAMPIFNPFSIPFSNFQRCVPNAVLDFRFSNLQAPS